MAQYSWVKPALDCPDKVQRVLNCDCDVVLATSLQCTKKMDIVSRGTLRSQMLSTAGIV